MLDRLKRAAAAARREREARDTPDYGEAERIHEERPRGARRRDEATTSERVTTDVEEYREAPGEADYPHVDTGPDYDHGGRRDEGAFRTMERIGTIAPPMGNPTLDPAGNMVEVSRMAGYGDGAGYDALDGVDRMVLGRADATEDLRAEGATRGPPLQLEETESVYSDDLATGTHDLSMDPREDPAHVDWTAELGAAPGGGLEPADYCSCLRIREGERP